MTGAALSGVVTFLFTDIEGSTRRWETDADAMRVALAAHDDVLCKAIEAQGAGCSSTPVMACVPRSRHPDPRLMPAGAASGVRTEVRTCPVPLR
jgi:hypothetical protein